MRAEDVTPEAMAAAFRTMRLSAGLSQIDVCVRSAALKPPLKRLSSTQVSEFERGIKLPTLVNLMCLVVASSTDGETLDLSLLQDALEKAADRSYREEGEKPSQPPLITRRQSQVLRADFLTEMSLSEALRDLRKTAGMTQTELSNRTGNLKTPLKSVAVGQISGYERGSRKPGVWNLLSILVALSADGSKLDLSILQKALATVARKGRGESTIQGLTEEST
jgi:transcriptional regulator with XRE-family HTH domain